MSNVEEEPTFSGCNNEESPCCSYFEESSDQKKNDDEQQVDSYDKPDDDFDEFGEFEEASTTYQASASTSTESATPFVSTDVEHVLNLADVSDSSDLWIFDGSYTPINRLSSDILPEQSSSPLYDHVNTEICDLFATFDFCDEGARGECGLNDFETESLKLWRLLCFVEETAALKFLWSKSVAYSNFLDALHIRNNVLCGQINTAPSASKLSSFSALDDSSTSTSRENTNSCIIANNTNMPESNWSAVDSLSVAPVEFEWMDSGLENPFTSSSTTAISACVLECDNFFSADGNSTHSNGHSILEQELERMGLSNGHAPPLNTSNNIPVDLNELIRKNASNFVTKLSAPNGSKAKQYRDVNELSLEAKALHDRLPDYTYMLADRLMLPLSSGSELPENSMRLDP